MTLFAGRYRLLRKLGQGGMGEVYLAVDRTTGAECALKRLRPEAPVSAETLQREFEALTRVRHPALVAVREFGVAFDGEPYIDMEYVPGAPPDATTLRSSPAALIHLGTRVATGLEALHAAGVVHGDLKPGNLLVVPPRAAGEPPARVCLVDFGLAARLGRETEGHRGTAGFAAPELINGAPPSPATDLYGLGATLYRLAAGRSPFEGSTVADVLRHQRETQPSPLPLEQAGVPPGLIRLVLGLLSARAAERPASAREVRRELESLDPAARAPLAERLLSERLAGRERELGRLETLRRGATRRLRAAVVCGPPGTGKSALLTEVAARAALDPVTLVRLSCAAFAGAGALARALAERLAAREGPGSPAGATTRDGVDRVAEDDALDALVANAAGGALGLAERGRPALVLLDDAERMDPTSRAFARRLLLARPSPPLVWIEARPGSQDEGEDVERALREAGHLELIELGPLERSGVADLLASRLGEPAPDGLTDAVWRLSGGNPGLAVEALLDTARAGVLRDSETGLLADRDALLALAPGADFVASRRARLAALDPAARAAAVALAVAGRALDLHEIESLAPESAPGGAGVLIRAGLARVDDRGHLSLSPPALGPVVVGEARAEVVADMRRRVLDRDAPPSLARVEHARALGDLERARAEAERAFAVDRDPAVAIAMARMLEGSDPVAAAAWHERAARSLAALGRYRDARGHWERALDLDRDAPDRARRWRGLAVATHRTGSAAQSLQEAERGLEEPGSEVDRAYLAGDAVAAACVLGLPTADIWPRADQALAWAEASGDQPAIAYAWFSRCHPLGREGKFREAEEAAKRAAEIAAAAGDFTLAARATVAQGGYARVRGDFETAAVVGARAIELARSGAGRVALEDALMQQSVNQLDVGRWSESLAAIEEGLRLALEDGRTPSVALALAEVSLRRALLGRVRGALRTARAGLRIARALAPSGLGVARYSLAVSLRYAGRLRKAVKVARRALGEPQALMPAAADLFRWELGRALAESGRWDVAAATWATGERPDQDQRGVGQLLLAVWSRRAALRAIPSGRAPAVAEPALPAPDQIRQRYARAHALWLEAERALERDPDTTAWAAARDAIAAFDALPCPTEKSRAVLALARIGLAHRPHLQPPDLERWLDEAAQSFFTFGDRRHHAEALALLVSVVRRPGGVLAAGRQLDLIESVRRLIDSLTDFDELTDRAMQLVGDLLGAERGALLLLNPKTGEPEPVAMYGTMDSQALREAVGSSRLVLRHIKGGDSFVVGDAASEALSESIVKLRLRSIACVPLLHAERGVVGAVWLHHSQHTDLFGTSETRLLEGFAHLMASALVRHRGHEEVRRQNEELVIEARSLREEAHVRYRSGNLLGQSAAMRRVLGLVELAARTNITVLLTGENGTGKEQIARTLHHSGRRKDGPFVVVNCGAIPDAQLEAELYGIEGGAATGVVARPGKFRQADGGTLLLDEIGEMPLPHQVALLGVLSNHEITPVGGRRSIRVDVRVIAATNRDLRRAIEEGRFREDLFYRLNVFPIEVPPLRERKADVPLLARHFLELSAREQERDVPQMSPEFIETLMRSDWPGNVRELRNYVERILAMTLGSTLRPDRPPPDLESSGSGLGREVPNDLKSALARVERRMIVEALEAAMGNQSLAARLLGMREQTLRYRLGLHRIDSRHSPRIRSKK